MGRSYETYYMATKQNSTRALEGKTPYEMKNKKKPHLGGIQEFGAAAYVKDLKAAKLDARAQVG
jgi:hypothetical protein